MILLTTSTRISKTPNITKKGLKLTNQKWTMKKRTEPRKNRLCSACQEKQTPSMKTWLCYGCWTEHVKDNPNPPSWILGIVKLSQQQEQSEKRFTTRFISFTDMGTGLGSDSDYEDRV